MRDTLNTKQVKATLQLTRGAMLLLVVGLAVVLWATPHLTSPQSGGLLIVILALIPLGVMEGLLAGPKKRKVADATKGWGSDQKAVSPVIGVILMVAITVVLAAVVFTLVMQLSSHSATQGGQGSFETLTPTTNSLSFRALSIDTPFDWTSCALRDGTGLSHLFTINGAGPTSTPLSAAGDVLATTGLTTKTTYDFALVCGGHTTANLHGTTL